MKIWKVVGLAGIAGVAASGVLVARAERQRQAYSPEDVRQRLHQRLEQNSESDELDAPDAPPALP